MSDSEPSISLARKSAAVWLVSLLIGFASSIWVSWAVQRWWLIIPVSAAMVGLLRWWLCRQVMTPPHHSSRGVHVLSWVSLGIPIVSLGIFYCSPRHSTEHLIPVQLVAAAMALVSLGTLRGWRSYHVLIAGGIAVPLALAVAYHLIFANMRWWH